MEVILNRGKLIIPTVANDLFLSEASIFRRIKNLNHLLEEFQIQIKQGSLVGPESQIRFFYYNMILNSYSTDDLIELRPSYLIDVTLNILEKKYNYIFSEAGRIRINIWGNILLKRLNIKLKDYDNLKLAPQLDENPLYRAIKNSAYTAISQYAIHLDEYEIYLIYIFTRIIHSYLN